MIKALVEELRPLVEARNHLARKAETGFAMQLSDIIREGCKDPKRIEWLLTCMLDFGFDDRILALFKKLCRYYYPIAPDATARYVYSYRDMWDEDYTPEAGYDAESHTSNSNA